MYWNKQQIIENLISDVPDSKLDTILAFITFVLHENNELDSALLSEPSPTKDWTREEDETAWQDL